MDGESLSSRRWPWRGIGPNCVVGRWLLGQDATAGLEAEELVLEFRYFVRRALGLLCHCLLREVILSYVHMSVHPFSSWSTTVRI